MGMNFSEEQERMRAYKDAWAAAWDAGNRHMAHHGRSVWNAEDFDVACRELDRLWRLWPSLEYPHPYEQW